MTASETFDTIFLINKFTFMADGANHFAVIDRRFLLLGGGCCRGSGFLIFLAINDTEFAEVFFDNITDFGSHRGDIFTFFEVTAVGVIDALQFVNEEGRTGIIAEDGGNESAHSNDP